MTRRDALVRTAVLIGYLTVPMVVSAHPGHVTLMEAELDSGRLEVALQVQRKDLDRALAAAQPKQPLDAAVHGLVKSQLQLKDKDGRTIPLEWVGLEKRGFVVWIYFQWTLKQPLTQHTLSNRLFLDLEPRAVHTVNLSSGKKGASLTYRQGQTTHRLPTLK